MSTNSSSDGQATFPSAAPTPPAAPAQVSTPCRVVSRQRASWQVRYAWAVVATDVATICAAVVLGDRLGLGTYSVTFGSLSPTMALLAGFLLLGCLLLNRAHDLRVLGSGSEEFSRVIRSTVTSAVTLGLAGLVTQVDAVRPWVFGILPLAGLLVGVGRLALRKQLHARRRCGECVHRVLAVGNEDAVADLIDRTRRDTHTGWLVAGACTPSGRGHGSGPSIRSVPVVGDLDSVADQVDSGRYRVVSVGPAAGWTPRRTHQLAWRLEGSGAELVVDPGLMEIAGPRLHVAPVDGLPLLRLTEPQLSGVPRVLKCVIDRVGAALLLLLLAPLLVATALAVRTDGGPVLFCQVRVGRHGRPFKLLKFRSMVVDAEDRRHELMSANQGSGPLFKLACDPRVTRVGSTLRRYSLDELPQLLNVLGGSMSLVGPRPPLPEEVASYGQDAARKLLVRPGVTGLWQVSGRSDLSWEESVRLDLRYAENWTLALDAMILWKTIGTVLRRDGAY